MFTAINARHRYLNTARAAKDRWLNALNSASVRTSLYYRALARIAILFLPEKP
jgi:O-succinylbenzoate synthase